MRFVAVHGGCHGAWAWDYLIPELAKLGHELIAVELPGHGERAHEVSTLSGYRDAVVAQMRPGDILLGHSSGSVVATMAADARPDLVAHIVYLCGILPVEGQPLPTATTSTKLGGGTSDSPHDDDAVLDTYIKPTEDGSAFYFERQGAVMAFYNDCDEDMVDWAFSRLVPEPFAPLGVPVSVPTFWAADLPRSFIMGTIDASCPPALAKSESTRLGVDPLVIESGHSPFLSRPAELARLLQEAVKTQPHGPLVPTLAP